MKPPYSSKSFIRNNKEIYYPLFTIICTFILYWIISFFMEIADSHTVFPFLFFTIDLFIIKYLIDYNREFKNKNLKWSIILFLTLCAIFFLSMITTISLFQLVMRDLFYLIPISIHFISIFIIYYFLRNEVIKYYKKQNRD